MSSLLTADVLLAPYTTWKVSGTAEWWAQPKTLDELRTVLQFAKENQHPLHVLGRGSNLLITPLKLKGVTICLRKFSDPESNAIPAETSLQVSAGMALPALARQVANLGYTGYEFYIGIPGTVGGAVVMNAGFGPGDERQTANRCTHVTLLEPATGEIETLPYADLRPTYRHTLLSDSGFGIPDSGASTPESGIQNPESDPKRIVLSARFALGHPASRAQIRAETAHHLHLRKSKQPLTAKTAGSVFKALPDGTPAAVLIDQAGLKGQAVGGARVSPKHANWIENHDHATATDIFNLIRHIQETIGKKTGHHLEPEVTIW